MNSTDSIELIAYILFAIIGIAVHLFKKQQEKAQRERQAAQQPEMPADVAQEGDMDDMIDDEPVYMPAQAPVPATPAPSPKPPKPTVKKLPDIDTGKQPPKILKKHDDKKSNITQNSEITTESSDIITLAAQARSGMIWSEILLPPVAMRQ